MALHPLLERARTGSARQASGFHEAAAALGAELLRAEWEAEVAAAPRRGDAGKRYLAERRRPPARLARGGRDQDPLVLALWRHAREPARSLALPDGTAVQVVGARIPLRGAASDAAADPDRGVGEIDLLGVTEGGRLVVIALGYVDAAATRVGTGDTPLRSLLEGLAACAIAWANRDVLGQEIADAFALEVSDEPPALVLLGVPRYWELCRRRAAQKGAAWIHQMERLAQEVAAGVGVGVYYLALPSPEWSLDAEGWPALAEPPKLVPAWEEGAGRVRPRPPPRPKARLQPVEVVVEADPSRPVREYRMTSSYQAGDRVAHPQFGEGVVQGPGGSGKIRVRFEGQERMLVHERQPAGA